MRELKLTMNLRSTSKRKTAALLMVLISMVCLSIGITSNSNNVQAFSPQVIQHGAVGEDVIELQARLKHIGFFHGKVDGVFGWSTYWALRNFQYEFGMEIDGMAGAKTKEKLAKATKYNEAETKKQMYKTPQKQQGQSQTNQNNQGQQKQQQTNQNTQNKQQPQKQQQPKETETTAVNVPQGFSQNDIKLMANAVYGEARGEPYIGKVAVAAVILNRVKSDTFPNTISGVIFEPRAFTAVADGQIWLEPDDEAERAVLDAVNGTDPTGEAIYYFNPDTATSPWIWSRQQVKKIGKHIFSI